MPATATVLHCGCASIPKPRVLSGVKVSMAWQILLIVVVGVPGVFLATLGYVGALLSIAKHFSGAIKMLIALPVYVLYSVVLAAPLFYMLGQFRPEIQASNLYFAGVLFA